MKKSISRTIHYIAKSSTNFLDACKPNAELLTFRHRDLMQYIRTGGPLLVLLTYMLICIDSYIYFPMMNPADQTLWLYGCTIIAITVTTPVLLMHFSWFQPYYEMLATIFSIIALVKFGVAPQLFEAYPAAVVESYSCLIAVIIIALALRLQLSTLIRVFVISSALILAILYILVGLSEVNWIGIFYYYFSVTVISLKMSHLQTQLERENLQKEKIIQQQNVSLTRIANQDSLTGLSNRRFFDETLAKEWSRHQRSGRAIAALYIDVDHFKKYNDYYGHQIGDQCLIQVSQCIKHTLFRASDTVARYGGEEFVVLLPDIDSKGAKEVASRIIDAIAKINIPHENSIELGRVSVSVGAAITLPNRDNTQSTLLSKADNALYEAKKSGRNCFVMHANEFEATHTINS